MGRLGKRTIRQRAIDSQEILACYIITFHVFVASNLFVNFSGVNYLLIRLPFVQSSLNYDASSWTP